MSVCTEAELALKKCFEEVYARTITPVMQEIEREVCGCDYGGNSWTTLEQADQLNYLLRLGADTEFIDLGSGTGWPSLYLAKKSGCHATLVDLPENSIRIARKRSQEDGISDRVTALVADAAVLPLGDACFNAISHSDLLCCLVQKQKVLEECRRIVRPGGRMAFTVISITFGLSRSDHARAIENGPEFIETQDDYAALLDKTGWLVEDRVDLIKEYLNSCKCQIQADRANQEALEDLLGSTQTEERIADWCSKLEAISEGLFRRELYLCSPSTSS